MADFGFQSGFQGALDDQDNKAFKLKVLNAQLEGQLKNQLAEQNNTAQIEKNRFDSEQAVSGSFLDLLRGAGNAAGMSPAELGDLTKLTNQREAQTAAGLIDARARAQGHTLGSMAAPKPQLKDVNGKIQWVIFDPVKQQTTLIPVGTNPKNDAEARKIYGQFDSADHLLTNMEDNIKPILTSTPVLNLLAQRPTLKLNELAQVSPDAAAAFDYIRAHAPTFAVALRGTSRVSEMEINQLLKALPDEGDTIETAQKKLNNFRTLFDQLKYSKIHALEGGSPEVQDPSKASPFADDNAFNQALQNVRAPKKSNN